MRKRKFLTMFYEDKAKQTIMQIALKKAIDLKLKKRIKKYSEDLIELENHMSEYIIKSERLIKRINFTKESSKYRIEQETQKRLTNEIIGIEMTIDELEEWAGGKSWNTK